MNVYAAPALLTLILLVLETIFLMVALPETRGTRMHAVAKGKDKADNGTSSAAAFAKNPVLTVKERVDVLTTLRRLHFLFLGVFSGIEFTLTFLTFDCKSLDFSNP